MAKIYGAGRAIIFEPWGLGDAVVALATAVQDADRLSIVCSPRWLPVLRAAAPSGALPELIPMEVSHGSRQRTGESLRTAAALRSDLAGLPVLSIRGDPRDYLFARKLFPESPIRMRGWVAFFAKRLGALNLPYERGWTPVMYRYRAWAELAGVEWSCVEAFYRNRRLSAVTRRVGIHVGAQWRSRQYPRVAELARMLRDVCEVSIFAGPDDVLPEGMEEHEVARLVNEELVDGLRGCTDVVANDSGPMHLAAFLGCRVIAVARHQGLGQWLPPSAVAVEAAGTPQGYRPRAMDLYLSDAVSDDWPSPLAIARALHPGDAPATPAAVLAQAESRSNTIDFSHDG